MTKKKIYTLKEFQEGMIAVWLPKESMYNPFMKRLEKAGVKDGVTRWSLFKNKTCIHYLHNLGEETISCDKHTCEECEFVIIKPCEINLVEDKVKPTAKPKITITKNAKAIAKTMSIQANNETDEVRVHRPFGYMKGTLNTPDNLEDLEGLEPTAEDKKGICEVNDSSSKLVCKLSLDFKKLEVFFDNSKTLEEVILRSKGKEKVITRDDFKKDLGFAEGSRAWALLALDRGEMITHKSLDKIKAIYLDKNILRGWNLLPVTLWCFPKDGWEIYEEIEMMLFKEMLKEKGNCSFRFINRLKNDTTIYRRDCGEVLFKDRTGTKNKLSLEAVADLADEQVEIIKGAE